MSKSDKVWIARDFLKCSGCRLCEIVCSLHHEGRIWPEASRVRVFMLVPGVEYPHLCAQCHDHPCMDACPTGAITVNDETGAINVNRDMCTGCASCVDACPGRIPHLHPTLNYALICDLCGGDPECAKICTEGGWNALRVVPHTDDPLELFAYRLYARKPEDATRGLVLQLYGEAGEEFL
ncbi:MAG: 4Fe-4S dicluster domain-containing protein [Nitrososphaerota archaeon]